MKLNQVFSYLILILLIDCSQIKENHPELHQLHYHAEVVDSAPLSCSINAIAMTHNPELKLDIELRNLSTSEIVVRRIRLENSDGIQAKLKEYIITDNIISAEEKSNIASSFLPINDYELYTLTGNYSGPFLQKYYVIIDHEIDKQIKTAKVEIRMLEEEYNLYIQNIQNSFVAYKFKEDSFFIRNQEEYLDEIFEGATFVNITDNELAIAGLNFRIQAYWEHDTLHSNLFLVNHAEFPVSIDTSAFNIVHKSAPDNIRIVRIEKINGDKYEPTILRKGDRCIISLKKFMKEGYTNDKLTMSFLNTFKLANGKSLLTQNPELIKH